MPEKPHVRSIRRQLIPRCSAQKPVKCKKVFMSLLNLRGVNRDLDKEFRKAFVKKLTAYYSLKATF